LSFLFRQAIFYRNRTFFLSAVRLRTPFFAPEKISGPRARHEAASGSISFNYL